MSRTMWRIAIVAAAFAGLFKSSTAGSCPFHNAKRSLLSNPNKGTFDREAVANLDWKAVKEDLTKLMTDSQEFWPADWGNYGPLLIRQAWHCSGSYRTWDGRGGCDGQRQRFLPELAWPDNTNLDKARRLLAPIKEKYGAGLSWGDLTVLAGDVAIESMGGPALVGFCGGRIDDVDGTASLELGPGPEQDLVAPCRPGDGDCADPEAAAIMGLIYVNPEGLHGEPIPEKSVDVIRQTFGMMNMNDAETVALIGGGHAFGKSHGACPLGPGPGPMEAPENPYPGECGSGPLKGKGKNAFTSGMEGPWTQNPTQWDNEYFRNLLNYDWELTKSPADHHQFKPVAKAGTTSKDLPTIMMFTTDLALLKDPEYFKLVTLYAENATALDVAFSNAWYKLTSRDMGPVSRCLGPWVAPAQEFQHPLPEAPSKQPKWTTVIKDIDAANSGGGHKVKGVQDSTANGKAFHGALFATLAWQCASTFRATDYQGGCDGARIRFSPQKDWPINKGLDKVVSILKPIVDKHTGLTYADAIVLAGTRAIAHAAGFQTDIDSHNLAFCPGRSDAPGDDAMTYLRPRSYINPVVANRDNGIVNGLTPEETVALMARPRSPYLMKQRGYSGSWSPYPTELSNKYFTLLLQYTWTNGTSAAGLEEHKFTVEGQDLYMLPSDIAIKQDGEFLAIARRFQYDNNAFLSSFTQAWTKMMNADRFDGPAGNVCDKAASGAASA